MRTVIVAQYEDRAAVYIVVHEDEVDPVAAIGDAAQAFLDTPDGQAYYIANVAPDEFNWGDAVIAIPNDTLAAHGVLRFEPLEGECAAVVNHDQTLAWPPERAPWGTDKTEALA